MFLKSTPPSTNNRPKATMQTHTIFITLLAGTLATGTGFISYQWVAQNQQQNLVNQNATFAKPIDIEHTHTHGPDEDHNHTLLASSNTAQAVNPIHVNDIKEGKKPLRPDFKLKDLEGKLRDIKEWDGKVIVLNFWATWCPPCKKEMPAFVELQKKHGAKGLQIIGLAIDQKNLVNDFADSIGINYPMLLGELDAVDIAKAYGNARGQLPYTVIINRQKQLVFVKQGEVLKEEIEKIISGLF